jgi:sulfite exporter TauE/SafE/copper chaperone CopZ
MSDPKKYQFYVCGMHCSACEMLTERGLKQHPKVVMVKSSLETTRVEIEGDFEGMSEVEILRELSPLLEGKGYELSIEKPKKKVKWGDFMYAFPIAFAFIGVFLLLQKMGIVNLVNASDVSYGTAFMVGIIASLSTCMALVGGLVLSMSANFAKEGERVRPQLMFHVGRIVSFFVLGGVIAMIGSTFRLGITGTFVLGMVVGLVMLILGLNLLDIFNFTKKLQPSMPKFISNKVMSVGNFNNTVTPVLVGIATFFLPCGFTQAMQIYSLSTGNFMSGALTMLFFALGTLPVLALISFSSFSIQDSKKSGIFFKSAGLVVIMFALFNIINSLVAAGYIAPIFNF